MWKRQQLWLILPLVWLFWGLALHSLVGDSPTMDEQNHLARGVAFVRTGDPRLSLEHPPLVNALAGLPVAWLMPEVRLPLDDPSWQRQPPDVYWYAFADLFMWQLGNDVPQMLFLGRLMVLFLTLALGLVAYQFARQVWGRPSAIVAFLLLLFDPNVLAHGRYITTDLGGTLFILLGTWLWWRAWQVGHWDWGRWALAGVGMGLALGSKLSVLVFVPIWAWLALWPGGEGWGSNAYGRFLWQRWAQLITAGPLALGVVWAIFGFEWRAFQFKTPWLAGLNQLSGPMPTFWAGIEQIFGLARQGRFEAFLWGVFSRDGFPLYFPVAFLVKTPLTTLLLLAVAVVGLVGWGNGRARARTRALFFFTPVLLYLLFSTQTALNIGYRHLLPILPFLYLGGVGCIWQTGGTAVSGSHKRTGLLITLLLLAHISTALRIHPHYLSYFNLLAGGPANGYRVLNDSNVDWGQDLLRLQTWMKDNEVARVKLAWFGTADPDYYGLAYDPLPGLPIYRFYQLWGQPPFDPAQPEPGVYAISVGSLWETPLAMEQKYVYAWFRQHEPDDRVGYSILIYDLRGER